MSVPTLLIKKKCHYLVFRVQDINMLVFEKPCRPKAAPQTRANNTQRETQRESVEYSSRWVHKGWVCVVYPFLFALGTQRKRGFQWNMDFTMCWYQNVTIHIPTSIPRCTRRPQDRRVATPSPWTRAGAVCEYTRDVFFIGQSCPSVMFVICFFDCL